MPRLPKLLIVLAVLVAVGISTVWEHLRAVRAGYRLAALEQQREKLREERRKLEVKRAKEERLDVLEERARKIGVPIPGEAPAPEAFGD
jgi:hypothetical protein